MGRGSLLGSVEDLAAPSQQVGYWWQQWWWQLFRWEQMELELLRLAVSRD